jgi:exopolysaccharide biosynthesis predicted pyruvyltransferase EpsI
MTDSIFRLNGTDDYVDFLGRLKGNMVSLIPIPGNAGDALIAIGQQHLLRSCTRCLSSDITHADYLVSPGGNPSHWFLAHKERWDYHLELNHSAKLILGPCTFSHGSSQLLHYILKRQDRIAGVFARDPASYTVLKSVGLDQKVTIGLGHDPAVHLRENAMIKELRAAGTSDYVLQAIRTDRREALPPATGLMLTMERIPIRPLQVLFQRMRFARFQDNLRASVRRNISADLRIVSDDVSLHHNHLLFLDLVRGAAEVHTNRLHVMIAACLLGKKTFGYATSYGKLEAVYDHSVRQWADVTFSSAILR